MSVWQDAQGRWHAEACVQRRRLHRRLPAGATEGAAKRLEAELTVALHAQAAQRLPSIPGDPPLVELLADYHDRHAKTLRSTDTAQYHARRIGRWLEGKRASDTRAVVAKIVDDLRPVYAPATINRSLSTLSKALGDAWRRGRTSQDWSGLVQRLPEHNERTSILTFDQVRSIANAASEQVRIAIWVSYYTGCRRGEICGIQREHIHGDTILLQAGATKTERPREVHVVPQGRKWVARLPLEIGPEGVKSGWRRASEAAGLPDAHFHDLRRSYGTLLLRSGEVSLHEVSKALGHSSTAVTEKRYAFLLGSDTRKRINAAFGRKRRA